MAEYLCISATFLDPRFHGRGDGGEPEWPPSPLRMMQALVAANADQIGTDGQLDHALCWLEHKPPPLIVAPRSRQGASYCLSVPNNAMDLVAKAWTRGNYFGKGDSSPATHRTMKSVRPVYMVDGDTVHYLWKLDPPVSAEVIDALVEAAGRIVALGWGIDLVVGAAERIGTAALRDLAGERWFPTPSTTQAALRVPRAGTLEALRNRHRAFIHRMGDDGLVPVEPLTRFEVAGYRRPTDPVTRPTAVFELRHDDGSFCAYSQRKLVHIAGMVRHLAKELMQKSPPTDVDDGWVERYVVGHQDENANEHRQLSYLPLPSIRAPDEPVNQAVRRVMVAAPVGDDARLEHLAHRLAGQQLVPERRDEFGDKGPPTLIRVYRDKKVVPRYTEPANRWASVTPVVLPGHDDRKPAKTRRLIEKALAQSGIEQPCEFEWSAFSRFRKSLSAHKYHKDRDSDVKRWQFENVKEYLRGKTWVHLTLKFNDELKVPGPLAIGAGRHCGLGIFAADE